MTADVCPGCGGPVTFRPADPDGIVVYFECPEPTCKYGKPERPKR
jgi:hypothetical protein